MKKILSFIMIVFSLFLLASCDLFNGDKRQDLEMTTEEMQAVINEVDLTELVSDIIVLNAELDIKVQALIDTTEFEEAIELALEAKGKVDVYANLKSFAESYIYVDIDLNYEVSAEYEFFVPYDEEYAEYDPYYEEEYEQAKALFNNFKKLSLVGKAYVIKGVLYLNTKLSYGGTTIEMKEYYELFDEEEFAEFKSEFEENISEDVGEIDLSFMPEEITIKPSKTGKSYEFEFRLTNDLEKIIQTVLGSFIGVMDTKDSDFGLDFDLNISKNTSFENYLKVQFSDKFEKFVLYSNIDVEFNFSMYDEDGMGGEIDASLYVKLSVDLDLNGKMPIGLPKESDFKDYVEGTNFSMSGLMFN